MKRCQIRWHYIQYYANVSIDADHNSHLVVHAGINDILETKSEELLEKYCLVIQHCTWKAFGRNRYLLNFVRISTKLIFYNKVISTHSTLKTASGEMLCYKIFIDILNDPTNIYQADGLKWRGAGNVSLGRLFFFLPLLTLYQMKWKKTTRRGHL